jgi:chromosome segregation protein
LFLKRLELVGFKSFAARTSTEFLPGIVVVVGPNGSGKCVTGDSLVTLDDGRDVPIRDLVDEALVTPGPVETLDDGFVTRQNPRRLHVLSLNPASLRIERRPIAAFVKRTAPATLLRVRTRSGREVTVTPDHPLFTLSRGRLQTLTAGELKAGVHVALPRRLPSRGKEVVLDPVDLIGRFSEADRVYVSNSSQLRAWAGLVRQEHSTLASWGAGATPELAKDQLHTLRTLALSDVYWDTVVAVDELTPSDPWVYDLCVEGSHNFVANKVIVHNSNIADGVLWVLGEQSAKAVRARKPEEVIFAGSASRQPLGMAEVSLVLDNTDGSLPIEYAEVRVTRRLYRSGDSEYLLNGARVRLKDITQLLLHAGLSPDSYTVIGQGSIDELILQRPDERRVVFENVADIRRHQLRLNETRSKLAATEANLVRVQDVLAELTPHVRRLKGQADRAERAETFRAELHELLVRFFRARLARAHADRRRAGEDLIKATVAAQLAESDSLAGEQALRDVDERIAALDERFAVLRPRAEGFREQASLAERSLAVVRERIAGLGEQHTTLEADLERLQRLLGRLAVEEGEAAQAAGQLPAGEAPEDPDRLLALRDQLASDLAAFDAARTAQAGAQTELEAAERHIRETAARLLRTEQHLQSLQANLAVDQARQSDRATRLARLGEQIGQLQTEASAVAKRLEVGRGRQSSASAAQRQAAARLAQAGDALAAASQHADRLQGALAALGAADLSLAALGGANHSRPNGSELPPDWQDALQDLPVVGLAGDLAARIRPIDLLLGGLLRRIVVLASDAAAREAHRRLSANLPADAPAWAVLSMDGLLLVSPGERPLEVVGDEGQPILADWARQVRQLEEAFAAAESRRRTAEADLQAARAEVASADADERTARVTVGELEARLAELRRAESAARSELHQVRSEHDRTARSVTQRSDEGGRETNRAQAIREELARATAGRDALTDALTVRAEHAASLGQKVSEVRVEVAALEVAAGRREAERSAREALHARIQSELVANAQARNTITERMGQLGAQHAELAEREAQLTRQLETLQAELAPLENELHSAEQRRAVVVGERQAVEQRLGVLRAADRAAHETREARHVVAQRATDEVERLNTEINETQELEADMSGGAAWAEQLRLELDEHTEPREAFDLEATRRRIATLQRELRAVGGVAESVVDEYREMSERHAFLEHQSADLRAAMAELVAAATELEDHMRERFAEVFGSIQAAFQECFSDLFGGGEARLVLTEPDDLLRTGIEIVARPPGKKLQGLLSLSGGERALTIVSLLFGLLKINPTPFCVLDEVDAALDEANVQRFANLLAEFAQRIQFLVVTHNRATMDKADALYGVSMDAQGISQIFSVRPRALADART